MIDLIFCSDGNRRLAEIAMENRFLYGAQLPNTVYFSPYFADQDWKKPDKKGYLEAIARYKPTMASVIDWESLDQAAEILTWANDIAAYVKRILIIPKISGVIHRIPLEIAGKEVVLGYSVPTSYGSTKVEVTEFVGRPVHLLGGSPHAQLRLWLKLRKEVVSLDGNYSSKMALKYNSYWVPGNSKGAHNRWWQRLDLAEGRKWNSDAPYEAFRRSCKNIRDMWDQVQSDTSIAFRMLSKYGKENQLWLPMRTTENNS